MLRQELRYRMSQDDMICIRLWYRAPKATLLHSSRFHPLQRDCWCFSLGSSMVLCQEISLSWHPLPRSFGLSGLSPCNAMRCCAMRHHGPWPARPTRSNSFSVHTDWHEKDTLWEDVLTFYTLLNGITLVLFVFLLFDLDLETLWMC